MNATMAVTGAGTALEGWYLARLPTAPRVQGAIRQYRCQYQEAVAKWRSSMRFARRELTDREESQGCGILAHEYLTVRVSSAVVASCLAASVKRASVVRVRRRMYSVEVASSSTALASTVGAIVPSQYWFMPRWVENGWRKCANEHALPSCAIPQLVLPYW